MAIVYADRVKEQTTTSGIGTLSLNGAFSGFQTFLAGVGSGNETYYTIVDETTNEWEVGQGTVGAGTLSRNAVFASTNGGNLVNLTPGSKVVFATSPSEFFNGALTDAIHATTNHTGIAGVPAAEAFTATAHNATDHTAAPFGLLSGSSHDTRDHTGVPGVGGSETFTASVHETVDHTGTPFNLLTEPLHDALDHTGLTGIVSVPTRSWTIDMATPTFGAGTDTAPFFWRPGYQSSTTSGRYPVVRTGTIVAAVIDNTSGSTNIDVLVNGAVVFTFAAGGAGLITPVTGWPSISITTGQYVQLRSLTGAHEAAVVMFVEP